MEDRKLVQDFLNKRDDKAFVRLYESKTPHLYQMALRLTQDAVSSEELIQEMWIVAIRKLEDFQWKSELKTWLTGILINLFHSMNRKRMNDAVFHSGDFDVIDLSGNTEDLVGDLEMAISRLAPGHRQIIVLHEIEGYKHREIAEMLNISEGTSKSQLFDARKALLEFFNEDQKRIEK